MDNKARNCEYRGPLIVHGLRGRSPVCNRNCENEDVKEGSDERMQSKRFLEIH